MLPGQAGGDCHNGGVDVELSFRDLQQADLDRLDWSGGPAHLVALDQALHRAWQGEVDLVVGELRHGGLIACGAVNHTKPVPELWMLSVHPAWQSVGVGTQLIIELENRIRERGGDLAGLGVELDNPRARALYERLGYRVVGEQLEEWPEDSGAIYVTICTMMTKKLGMPAHLG